MDFSDLLIMCLGVCECMCVSLSLCDGLSVCSSVLYETLCEVGAQVSCIWRKVDFHHESSASPPPRRQQRRRQHHGNIAIAIARYNRIPEFHMRDGGWNV